MRITLPLCLLAAVAVSACASPQQRCVANVTQELRTINTLVAETELNLARGYTMVREPRIRTGMTMCVSPNDPFLFCSMAEPRETTRPVAIDVATEERMLRQLRARQSQLQLRAANDISLCEAQYPSG